MAKEVTGKPNGEIVIRAVDDGHPDNNQRKATSTRGEEDVKRLMKALDSFTSVTAGAKGGAVGIHANKDALVQALAEDYAKGKQKALEFDLGNGNKATIPVKTKNIKSVITLVNNVANAGRDKLQVPDITKDDIKAIKNTMLSELNAGLHQVAEIVSPPPTPPASAKTVSLRPERHR